MSEPATPPAEIVQNDDRLVLAKLLAHGASITDAIATSGLSPSEALRFMDAPEFQDEIESFIPSHDDIQQRFTVEAARNLEVIKELRDTAANDTLRFNAAKDLLDRGGFTPARRVTVIGYRLDQNRIETIDTTKEELANVPTDQELLKHDNG